MGLCDISLPNLDIEWSTLVLRHWFRAQLFPHLLELFVSTDTDGIKFQRRPVSRHQYPCDSKLQAFAGKI